MESRTPLVSLCVAVCVRAKMCVIILERDSLMAAEIGNRRFLCLPPLTSTMEVQSVRPAVTKTRTHISTAGLDSISCFSLFIKFNIKV